MPPSHPAAKPSAARAMTESIEDLVVLALHDVLREAAVSGNWGDVRGTSDSLIAIETCLPPHAYPRLRAAASDWLIGRSFAESGLRNWEEEVWDSAVALLALAGDSRRPERAIGEGVRWLEEHHRFGHDNWNDEPWETLWALLAIHATATVSPHHVPAEIPIGSLRWLLSLLDNPRPGLLVSWHYTGLLVLVAGRYASSGELAARDPAFAADLRAAVERVVARMVEWLASGDGAGELWTREVWSNSLVLWAAAENEAVHEGSAGLPRLVDWYRDRLRRSDLMTEDRAFACIALFHLLVSLETTRDVAVRRALEEMRTRVREGREAERAIDVIDAHEVRVADRVRERIARRLATTRPDFVARPPFLTTSEFRGYYTVHAHRKTVNVALIVAATAALTLMTVAQDLFGARMNRLVALVPIGLGALATLAQLMNLDLGGILGRGRGRAPEDA